LTGVTGFIGLHCCKQLLDQGYAVRGTLRNFSRKEEVEKAMRESNTSIDNLEIIELDLLSDNGWDDAAKDCDYLMHVASPISRLV
jgi:dihydroflavonol-4-reductase